MTKVQTSASFFKRRWKLILNILTVLALIGLVVAIRSQLVQTIENLFRVNAWLLLLLIPVQFLNYDAQTRQYRWLFAVVGHKLSYKFLFRTALELNFVNHVFPSGGVTGISYFGLRMRDDKISGAKATVIQLLKVVQLVLSFEVLIVLAMFFLAIEGHMSSIILLVAGSITTAMVLGTFGFVYVIGSRQRIAGFFTGATRFLNRILGKIRPGFHPETISTVKARALFEDLHENYILFSKDWGQLRRPLFWALMANVWEIMTVYVVYIAFGHFVNFGAVILAYAVANVAGLISVLPGGIGIYEGLMTLTLSATGVPSHLSLPVTVMYRVLSTILQLPPGYYLYNKTLKQANKEPSVIESAHG